MNKQSSVNIDIAPIVKLIQDTLQNEISNKLNDINDEFTLYKNTYKSINELPFILELTETNEKLKTQLEEERSKNEELNDIKQQLEEKVSQLNFI